jgi:hypothetical protein
VQRLLRLYDAALARAEAAEQGLHQAHQSADYWVRLETKRDGQRKAAESALAEATALLARIEKYAREDRASTGKTTRLARVLDETRRFLSRTPAPAAPTFTHPGAEQVFNELQARRQDVYDGTGVLRVAAPAAKAEPQLSDPSREAERRIHKRVLEASEKAHARIARAVAELEHDDYPRHAAVRALAVLRGDK